MNFSNPFFLFACLFAFCIQNSRGIKAFSSIVELISNSSGPVKDCAITTDNKYIIAAADTSFFITEVQTKKIVFTQIVTRGQETILSVDSTQDNQYLVVVFGIGGLKIYDISNITNPQELSTIVLGFQIWSVEINRKTENEVICVGSGFLSMIDITDKQAPKLINQFELKSPKQDQVSISLDGRVVAIGLANIGFAIYQMQNIRKGLSSELSLIYEQQVLKQCFDLQLSSIGQILYYVDPWEGLFMVDLGENYYSKGVLSKSDVTLMPMDDQVENLVWSVELSYDDQILYYGQQGREIVIFDVSNPYKYRILQQIPLNAQHYQLTVSKDGSKLVISHILAVSMIYHEDFEFTSQYPNFFNVKQSVYVSLPIPLGAMIENPNRIILSPDETYIVALYNTLGAYFVDISIPLRPQFLYNLNIARVSIDGIAFLKKQQIVIFGMSSYVSFYDISNPSNPVQLNQFTVIQFTGQYTDSDDISVSADEKYLYIANGPSGTAILDISDIMSPKIVGWAPIEKPGGSSEYLIFTKDQKYMFMSSRLQGFWIYDIASKENLNIKSTAFIVSPFIHTACISADEKFVFLSQQNDGISMYNIEDQYNPSFIKNFPTDLVTGKITLLYYPEFQYLIIGGSYQSTLNMLKSSTMDDNFQMDFMTNEYPEDCMEFVFDQKRNFAFAAAEFGRVRIFPIETTIVVTNEAFLNKIDLQSKRVIQTRLQRSDGFLIGNEYSILINFFNYTSVLKVVEIGLYQDFFIKPLPNFITFNPSTMEIVIKTDKLLLRDGKQTPIQILTTILSQLRFNSFIDTSLGITAEMSVDIFQSLQFHGYINQLDYPNYLIDLDKKLYNFQGTDAVPDFNNVNIKTIIREVLSKSINKYIFAKQVVPSLFIFPTETENFISTNSEKLEILIKIQDFSLVVLVRRKLVGVFLEYDDFSSQVVISGSKNNVISAIQNDIQYSIVTAFQNQSAMHVQITVDDSSNEKLFLHSNLDQVNFLKEWEQFEIRERLQPQFNTKNPDSRAYVNLDFYFEFSSNTFNYYEDLPLSYTAQYNQVDVDDRWIEFGNQTFFLVFNQQQRFISGKAPQNYLFKIVRIRIYASDGYQINYDEFQIQFYDLTVNDIFFIIAQIISVFGSVLGVIQYRATIFNYMCSQRYTTCTIQVKVGQKFTLCTSLGRVDLNTSRRLFLDVLVDCKAKQIDFLKDNQLDLELLELFVQSTQAFKSIEQKEIEFQLQRMTKISNEENKPLKTQLPERGHHHRHQTTHIQIRDSPIQHFNETIFPLMIFIGSLWLQNFQDLETKKLIKWLKKIKPDDPEQDYNPRFWYMRYADYDFSDYDDLKHQQSSYHPKITINESLIDNVLEKYSDRYNKSLLMKCIQAQCLGISFNRRFVTNCLQGGGLELSNLEIFSIQVHGQEFTTLFKEEQGKDDKTKHQKKENFQAYPPGKHPVFLHAGVVGNTAYVQGKPNQTDIGTIQIQYYTQEGFIVKAFKMEIIQNEDSEEDPEILDHRQPVKEHQKLGSKSNYIEMFVPNEGDRLDLPK